jgi:uncharacterized membrane protein
VSSLLEPATPLATNIVETPNKAKSGADPLLRIRRIGWTLLGLQLIGMLVFSTVEYHEFALTKDLGAYAQAWWSIAHGHLNPYSTVLGVQFWRNNSEFGLWPMSLLYYVYPHPIDLLWAQDLLVVVTEVVTFGWVLEVIARAPGRITQRTTSLVAVGTVLLLVIDPWAWETIAFDFHSHVLVALFVVLAGRALWTGKTRQLWWWVPLSIVSAALGGLYLVGVGLSGVLAGRQTRRTGLVVGGVGLVWFSLLSALDGTGVGGRDVSKWYGYLVGPHHGRIGLFQILEGAVRHPGLVAHMFASRWTLVFVFVAVVGIVGVFSPWGFGMALVVFVPSILNADPHYLRYVQSFQIWVAVPFILVGSVMVVVRLSQGGEMQRRAAVVIGAIWLIAVVVIALRILPLVPRYWLAVDPAASTQLARVEAGLPARAEVIVSQGVVGRFSERQFAYSFYKSERSFPVKSRPVFFIITPRQGVGEVAPSEAMAAVHFVQHKLGGRLLDDRDGVFELKWTPPPGRTRVTLP